MRRRLLLAVALGTLSGCASLARGGFVLPRAELVSLRPERVDFEGAAFGLTLRLQNPNDRVIDGQGLDATLLIEGVPFGRLRVESSFQLPAGGSTTLSGPFVFTWGEAAAAVRAAFQAGRLRYEVRGHTLVATPSGARPVRFAQRGELAL